ncbi:MAG: FecR family protein [Rhodanobacteraceae bacterium]
MKRSCGQIERIAASWLARRDGDHWSPADQSAFAAWLDQDAAHQVAFLRLQAAWRETGRLKALAAGAPNGGLPARGAWRRSPYFNPTRLRPGEGSARKSHRHSSRPSRFTSPAAGILAGLLVILLAGGLWWWRDAGHVERGAWRTALGGQSVVHLADGSTATLAGDSELRAALTRHERNLDLVRGEAFFEVAKDHSRPFVVHASGYRVIAVGTRFDVRRDSDGLRVVVTRGIVRLQSAVDPHQADTELPAGSIARIKNDDVFVHHMTPDQAMQQLGWRNGYAVFHDTALVDAIGEFNRYSTRKIIIADPTLDDLKVGGNFRLDNSDAFVRLLQQVFPVHAVQRGDRIVLSRRGRNKPLD